MDKRKSLSLTIFWKFIFDKKAYTYLTGFLWNRSQHAMWSVSQPNMMNLRFSESEDDDEINYDSSSEEDSDDEIFL